jgi:hypothetical protein
MSSNRVAHLSIYLNMGVIVDPLFTEPAMSDTALRVVIKPGSGEPADANACRWPASNTGARGRAGNFACQPFPMTRCRT